jgi:hypothetical protein
MSYPDRIPYNIWINSQMSIARFYGGIQLNGKMYLIEKDTNDLVWRAPPPRKPRHKTQPE